MSRQGVICYINNNFWFKRKVNESSLLTVKNLNTDYTSPKKLLLVLLANNHISKEVKELTITVYDTKGLFYRKTKNKIDIKVDITYFYPKNEFKSKLIQMLSIGNDAYVFRILGDRICMTATQVLDTLKDSLNKKKGK